MGKYFQEGDTIAGEKIVFQCRRYKNYGLIQLTKQHRGTAGMLKGATCTIEKKFRHIPSPKK
jgi:hypothetical protein